MRKKLLWLIMLLLIASMCMAESNLLPKLTVEQPPKMSTTSKKVLTVKGKAFNAAKVTLNGKPIELHSTGRFVSIVPLNRGVNNIVVHAENDSGSQNVVLNITRVGAVAAKKKELKAKPKAAEMISTADDQLQSEADSTLMDDSSSVNSTANTPEKQTTAGKISYRIIYPQTDNDVIKSVKDKILLKIKVVGAKIAQINGQRISIVKGIITRKVKLDRIGENHIALVFKNQKDRLDAVITIHRMSSPTEDKVTEKSQVKNETLDSSDDSVQLDDAEGTSAGNKPVILKTPVKKAAAKAKMASKMPTSKVHPAKKSITKATVEKKEAVRKTTEVAKNDVASKPASVLKKEESIKPAAAKKEAISKPVAIVKKELVPTAAAIVKKEAVLKPAVSAKKEAVSKPIVLVKKELVPTAAAVEKREVNLQPAVIAKKNGHKQNNLAVHEIRRDKSRPSKIVRIKSGKTFDLAAKQMIPSVTKDPVFVAARNLPEISLQLKNADVKDVVDILSRKSGLNIVADESLTGRVSINLNRVPFTTAFDLILQTYGYAYTRVGNTIIVGSRDKISSPASLETRVFRLYHSKAEAVDKVLQPYLSKEEKTSVAKDENSIIAYASTYTIDKMATTIANLDRVVQKQVFIEAKIIEIGANDLKNHGIDWGGSAKVIQKDGVPPDNSTTLKLLIPDLVLNYINQEGNSKVLASPKMAAINGEKASILVGDRYPYTVTNIDAKTGIFLSEIKFVESGVRLTIVPNINAENNTVELEVKTEVSFIYSFVGPGNSIPWVRTREASTTVRIKNGQTAVIGGLLNSEDKQAQMNVPILSDLPLIGGLFSSRKKENNETELILTLTPRIME